MKAIVRTASAVALVVVLLVGCGTSGDDSKDKSGSAGPTGIREALREGGIPCDLDYESWSSEESAEVFSAGSGQDVSDILVSTIRCATSQIENIDLPEEINEGEWIAAFGAVILTFRSEADFEEFARTVGDSSCEEPDGELYAAIGERAGEFVVGGVTDPDPWSEADGEFVDVDVDELGEEWRLGEFPEATETLADALGLDVQEVCEHFRGGAAGTSKQASACKTEKGTIEIAVEVFFAGEDSYPGSIDLLMEEGLLRVEPTYWTIDGTGGDGSSRIVPIGDLPEGCGE